ncbi:MAG: putative quinol monooxygenase [Pseudonocardiaceae bacterium]
MTLINVFEVDKSTQQELLTFLVEATEQVMRHRPGFISANLHTSFDGTRVANYAQWRSREDIEAALADPEAQRHMQRIGELARPAASLYSVAAVHHAPDSP